MNDHGVTGAARPPVHLLAQIDLICDHFEEAWSHGERPRIEDLLPSIEEPHRAALAAELLSVELEARRRLGEQPLRSEYARRSPELDLVLEHVFMADVQGACSKRDHTEWVDDAPTALLLGLFESHGQSSLIEILRAWNADRSRALAQILASGGGLEDSTRKLLEVLSAEHLERHEGEVITSLAALPPEFSTVGETGQPADPDLSATLANTEGAADFTLPDRPDRVTSAVARLMGTTTIGERYHVLRPHAKGGLGAVFVALDRELDREVALKEIQDRHADNPVSRSRFVLEAEITGGLEHPGIVPVYGLGTHEDGRPYYAMRLIRGGSFKEAIARFHADPSLRRDTGRRSLELRKLLRRFLDVCNAVGYAHSRGVIHRDLKPANIIVGKHGETLVIDWGLAKALGKAEQEADLDERPLSPSSVGSCDQTITGNAMGTPAFMSPEQARGEIERLGPRSDVYSLGATLFCLLTGSPPFDGEAVEGVILAVQRGEFPPPRQLDPVIDRPLESICLKAMALDPGQRYASCKALADDIERWMADEPVGVYREPFSTRITRWGHRNRTIASSLGAILITTVLALAFSTVLISREQARTEEQRKEALANYADARQQRDLVATRSLEATGRALALERQLYVNRISLAQRDTIEDVGLAEQRLGQCPPIYRGWEWNYLERLCHLDRRTLRGHALSVKSVAFSPDGTRLVSGGGKLFMNPRAEDVAELIVWDAIAGRELHRLNGVQGSVNSIAFSADGTRIVVASGYYDKPPGGRGTVSIWEVETGRMVFEDSVPYLNALAAVFSPDGRLVAAGLGLQSSDYVPGRFKVWEVATGSPILEQESAVGGVTALSFTRDSRRLALGCKHTIEFWSLQPARKTREIKGHSGWVYGLDFTRDGKTLATAGWDGAVRLWDAEEGTPLLTIDVHDGWVSDVKFSPDGNRIASCGADQTLRIWDRQTGRALLTLHGHAMHVNEVSFSPDGKWIASASEDRTVKIWDATTDGRVVFRDHRRWVNSVAFSPDGRSVATSDGDGIVAVWDPRTGQRRFQVEGHNGWISGVAFSPDGKILASTGEYGQLHLWSSANGTMVRSIGNLDAFARGVAFSPDGTLLAACTGVHEGLKNAPGSVYVWNARDGKEIRRFHGHSGRVLGLAFLADAKQIVSLGMPEPGPSGAAFEILIWKLADGEIVQRWTGLDTTLRCLAVGSNGRWLAAGGDDGSVRIWDILSGTEIRHARASGKAITAMAFSADGRRLAIGSYERAIRLWEPESGEFMLSLFGHTDGVTALAFSHDGSLLASGSIDNTCRIWDGSAIPDETIFPGSSSSSASSSSP
jgi:WD40 repeat protein/serine/threonine protein kinase